MKKTSEILKKENVSLSLCNNLLEIAANKLMGNSIVAVGTRLVLYKHVRDTHEVLSSVTTATMPELYERKLTRCVDDLKAFVKELESTIEIYNLGAE